MAILDRSPRALLVTQGNEMAAAERHAKGNGHSITFWGTGNSMLPLYASRTALVVHPFNFDKLKAGMTVVYWRDNGMRTAHCIVGETRGGYLVQGVANPREDPELLTEDNFIGVVVAAYTSKESDFLTSIADRLTAKRIAKVNTAKWDVRASRSQFESDLSEGVALSEAQ